MRGLRAVRTAADPYGAFRALDGAHPLRAAVPGGFVDYPARRIPDSSVVESLQPRDCDIKTISGQGRVLGVRGEYIPLYSLRDVLGLRAPSATDATGTVVVMEADGRKVALWVDTLVGQQQVVIKNLDANYRRIEGISGATIMGDGRVALIVDVAGLVRLARLPRAA